MGFGFKFPRSALRGSGVSVSPEAVFLSRDTRNTTSFRRAETICGAPSRSRTTTLLWATAKASGRRRIADRVRVGARVAAALAALALVALAVGVDVSVGASGSARAAGRWPALGAATGARRRRGGRRGVQETHVSRSEGGPLPDVDPLVTFNTPVHEDARGVGAAPRTTTGTWW